MTPDMPAVRQGYTPGWDDDWDALEDERPSWLSQPFSPLASALIFVCALAAVGLVYSITELLAHADWADGARVAGVTALALAIVTLIVTTMRVRAGQRTFSMVLLSGLMIAVLAASGIGGVVLTAPLRQAQARHFEQSGQWSDAIHEYALIGEKPPNAPNIARLYNTWGKQLLQQRQYAQAATQFSTVVEIYSRSGAITEQARGNLYMTYRAWITSGAANIHYADAISALSAYRQDTSCDAACQSAAASLEAQARYQYGVQLAGKSAYTDAIQQFETVQAQFKTSPYAFQAHAAAATAYYAEGQQQLATTCNDAVPTYQTLAKNYGDTPEGKKAKAALAAPQSVTGTLINIPSSHQPTVMYLSKSVDTGNYFFSDDYKAGINAHSGAFSFKGVAQGKYNLSTSRDLGTQIEYDYLRGADGSVYSIRVGPLCATQLGSVSLFGS